MHSNSNILYREIKKISNLNSLIIARYFVLLSCSFSLLYFITSRYRLYGFYIALFVFFAPSVLEHALPDKNSSSDTIILPTLKKSYAYNYQKYICLMITFWLCNILLFCWQVSATLDSNSDFFSKYFPSFVLSGHIIIYLALSYYYRIKLHSRLINNRW